MTQKVGSLLHFINPLREIQAAKAKNQHCMLSAAKQTMSIKLATTVGHFLPDLGPLQMFIYGLAILLFIMLFVLIGSDVCFDCSAKIIQQIYFDLKDH